MLCMALCAYDLYLSARVLDCSSCALDEMGSRIDDLEKSIADLMEQVRRRLRRH